jgi:hypothetical protein
MQTPCVEGVPSEPFWRSRSERLAASDQLWRSFQAAREGDPLASDAQFFRLDADALDTPVLTRPMVTSIGEA